MGLQRCDSGNSCMFAQTRGQCSLPRSCFDYGGSDSQGIHRRSACPSTVIFICSRIWWKWLQFQRKKKPGAMTWSFAKSVVMNQAIQPHSPEASLSFDVLLRQRISVGSRYFMLTLSEALGTQTKAFVADLLLCPHYDLKFSWVCTHGQTMSMGFETLYGFRPQGSYKVSLVEQGDDCMLYGTVRRLQLCPWLGGRYRSKPSQREVWGLLCPSTNTFIDFIHPL